MKTRLLAFAVLVVSHLIGSSAPARAQVAAPNTVNSAAIIDRTIEAVDIKNPITAAGVAVPTLGVEATQAEGRAVDGVSLATTGRGTGVIGRTQSKDGRGVAGFALAVQGTSVGVFGRSDSQTTCVGVLGSVGETLTMSTGVAGTTRSVAGGSIGVTGVAFGMTGKVVGVRGLSDSNEGVGVSGSASSLTGATIGVAGASVSPEGIGVGGTAEATTGRTFGVVGANKSTTGCGVRGDALATTGLNFGVFGRAVSPDGYGVLGGNISATGSGIGVRGLSVSTTGSGVFGVNAAANGVNVGVQGQTASATGFGVFSQGNMGTTGMKAFIQPHPSDPSQEIHFVCLEGNESGTYFRGSTQLVGRVATIHVPEEFRLVTETDGLTVQLTVVGAPALVWVERQGLDEIVVRGSADVRVNYFVNGVRRGFAQHQALQANTSFVPALRGVPFGTQYPDALRRVLVDNGILNADFTPNEHTAARMGWELADPDAISVDALARAPLGLPPPADASALERALVEASADSGGR